MVKQITEDDLAAGLSGFGDGLTTITERPRRDNPFRDTRAEVERRPPEKVEKVIEMRPGVPPADTQAASTSSREHEARPESHSDRRITGRGASAEPAERPESPYARELPVRTIEESAREVRVHYPEPEPLEKVQLRKADIFTERVTLSMSTEMRDDVEALARELQRRRTRKDERITANTVMRVAIQSLLERLNLEDWEAANNEADLLELARRKLR